MKRTRTALLLVILLALTPALASDVSVVSEQIDANDDARVWIGLQNNGSEPALVTATTTVTLSDGTTEERTSAPVPIGPGSGASVRIDFSIGVSTILGTITDDVYPF